MIYVFSEEVGIVHGVQTLDLEVTYFIAGTDSTNIANVYLLDDPPRGKARDQRYNDSSYFASLIIAAIGLCLRTRKVE